MKMLRLFIRAGLAALAAGLFAAPCDAKLTCPQGTAYRSHANFEYCAARDDAGKEWYHGPFIRYYITSEDLKAGVFANTQKEEVGTYSNGKKDGVWTQYHLNGSKARQTLYVLDKAEGISRQWNADGIAQPPVYYKEGQLADPLAPLGPAMRKKFKAAAEEPLPEDKQQKLKRLKQGMDALPKLVNPCEREIKRHENWMRLNAGRADYAQAIEEADAQHKLLESCTESTAYKRYQAETEVRAKAFQEDVIKDLR